MTDTTDKPGPGKFEGCEYASVAEYLYTMSLEGWYEDTYGESEFRSGWNALLFIDVANFTSDATDDPRLTSDKLKPAYIVTEDNNGFFTYEEFESQEDAKKEFNEALGEYYGSST